MCSHQRQAPLSYEGEGRCWGGTAVRWSHSYNRQKVCLFDYGRFTCVHSHTRTSLDMLCCCTYCVQTWSPGAGATRVTCGSDSSVTETGGGWLSTMSKAKKTFTSVFLGTVAATLAFVGVFLWQQHCTYPGSPRLNREERKLRTPQVRNRDGNTTIEPQPTPDEYSGVVQKSVFSPKMRMVVPVGLEGTGHHTMNKALTEMCKLDTVVCPVTCDVSQALYHYIGTPKDESDYMVGLKKLHDAMEALALTADGLNNEISLAFSGNCRFSTMSFPSFGGPDKPLQYVDLKILAREAERVGIDLRLIYLGRSARDILISTTQHRHFGGT